MNWYVIKCSGSVLMWYLDVNCPEQKTLNVAGLNKILGIYEDHVFKKLWNSDVKDPNRFTHAFMRLKDNMEFCVSTWSPLQSVTTVMQPVKESVGISRCYYVLYSLSYTWAKTTCGNTWQMHSHIWRDSTACLIITNNVLFVAPLEGPQSSNNCSQNTGEIEGHGRKLQTGMTGPSIIFETCLL